MAFGVLTPNATHECSHVVVQREFVGVGAEADQVDLLVALEGDPGFDQVFGEDAAFDEVVVVGFQAVDDGGEGVGDLGDVAGFLGGDS